jgi:hypothetical protein
MNRNNYTALGFGPSAVSTLLKKIGVSSFFPGEKQHGKLRAKILARKMN